MSMMIVHHPQWIRIVALIHRKCSIESYETLRGHWNAFWFSDVNGRHSSQREQLYRRQQNLWIFTVSHHHDRNRCILNRLQIKRLPNVEKMSVCCPIAHVVDVIFPVILRFQLSFVCSPNRRLSEKYQNSLLFVDVWICFLICAIKSIDQSHVGGLSVQATPQIVLLTFDDAVNDINKDIYSEIFDRDRTNPNGCPITATFYVSHEWTDYSQVQNLYARGHEMASHTVS